MELSPKSKALQELMEEIMKNFISKDFHEKSETPEEEIKEEGALEELDHPQLGKAGAEEIAEQHLMSEDKDEYGEHSEPTGEEDKPKLSMSLLAAKMKPKSEGIEGMKGSKKFRKGK